uniref:Uncharacterized protein n=1 Tax=Cacopsylla melanoneura TaxID=428564 RepID=A0A8D8SZZ4_9HEMI
MNHISVSLLRYSYHRACSACTRCVQFLQHCREKGYIVCANTRSKIVTLYIMPIHTRHYLSSIPRYEVIASTLSFTADKAAFHYVHKVMGYAKIIKRKEVNPWNYFQIHGGEMIDRVAR